MNIRNFAIVAHIDHGKSTLADRLLEITGTVPKEKLIPQFLDRLSLERERGITIKMQPVRMKYHPQAVGSSQLVISQLPNANSQLLSNPEYILNLIDTPGHADFSYEVSRALKAVEGVILLVDGVKGVQAQTVFNFRQALGQKLAIIPAINKIDLREADVERVQKQILNLFSSFELPLERSEILAISAKTGQGVTELLEVLIKKIPSPRLLKWNFDRRSLQALIFDSLYDPFKGVLAYIRVFHGNVRAGDIREFALQRCKFRIKEVGIFSPDFVPVKQLETGDIGYIATGIKEAGLVQIGETIRSDESPLLEGFVKPQLNVFASFYPLEEGEFKNLQSSLEKLQLNDPAIVFDRTESPLLGRGFRVGFLGKLHMEIVAGRLEEELGTEIIIGSPSVAYKIDGKIVTLSTKYPEYGKDKEILEPWVKIEIFTPSEYLGAVMKLLEDSEGMFKDTAYLDEHNIKILFEMPLSQIVTQDFYDKLKSVSSGFASAEYEPLCWKKSDKVRLDILIAGEYIDAFSKIVQKSKAQEEGRKMVKKLKELLPQAQFVVSLQARVEGRIIAREDIPALKKAVTEPLYGGDFTRKKKLLVKQREGKKRLRQFGRVSIPKEVFLKMV